MPSKILLALDADEFLYRVGFRAQTTTHTLSKDGGDVHRFRTAAEGREWLEGDEGWEADTEVKASSELKVRALLDAEIRTIVSKSGADEVSMYLSGKDNFRHGIATILPYKGNRTSGSKPLHYGLIKDLLLHEHGAEVIEGAEADDAMSIQSWTHQLERPTSNWGVVIGTQDKDLQMVPGLHFHTTKYISSNVSVEEGRAWFYKQLLMGDSTDNIQGIFRVGKAYANKTIDPIKSEPDDVIYKAVFAEYEKALHTPKVWDKMSGDISGHERIQEVARLLWMQQSKNQLWERGMDYYGELEGIQRR